MKKSLALGLLLGVALTLAVGVVLHFGKSSRVAASVADQPLPTSAKKQLWTCGMHPQVLQDHPGLCPICHMKLTPLKSDDDPASNTGSAEKKVAYWWDPMLGPSSISDHPGKSAMGMDLVPVYEQQVQSGPDVRIDPTVVQNMGIRTAAVTRGPITTSIQTVGVLEAPETGLHDISPKVGGWIEKLYANQEGQHVHQGEPLFDLYSPDLVVGEEELIGAVKSLHALGPTADDSLKASAQALVDSARSKLRLLDVPEEQIEAVADKLVAPRTVTFRSPASGAVTDKSVVEGSATQAGQKLMRIEDHSTLWLQLQVYEDQMALVAVGEAVQATVDAFPGKTFTGQITFVHPHVDHMSRTVVARAVLENAGLILRPGMYASAAILTTPVADAVQVPREAVIDTGKRQVAFVVEADGHYAPRAVRMGIAGDGGRVQILDGLSPGETVVSSGEFLLDVESRTTEAIEKLRASPADVTPVAAPAMSAGMPKGAEMSDAPATIAPVPSTSAPGAIISVAYCPMKKAHWLQRGGQILNPYFGTQMPGCGEVQRTVPVPADTSPLGPITSAYLGIEAGLAGDTVDKNATIALRTVAEQLSDPNYTELRSTAEAVASAADVSAARVSLKALSEALLQAVTAGGRP